MKTRFVAIVGGSGSGKTWLADRLAADLAGRAARLSLDDFYADLSHLEPARRRRRNFDHPRTIDWELLQRVLESLAQGVDTPVPRYDFTRNTRSPEPALCPARRITLIDGLWLLRPRALHGWFAWSVFIDCPAEVRLQRRLERDQRERDLSPDWVRRQFREHVEPMHRRYVEPQRRRAAEVVPSPVDDRHLRRLSASLHQLAGEEGA